MINTIFKKGQRANVVIIQGIKQVFALFFIFFHSANFLFRTFAAKMNSYGRI